MQFNIMKHNIWKKSEMKYYISIKSFQTAKLANTPGAKVSPMAGITGIAMDDKERMFVVNNMNQL